MPVRPLGRIRDAQATIAFWAAVGLFVLLTALHLVTPRLDSDQAVTGLMGVYILRGDFPVLFWGQNHAGVPESYGAAVTFFLLGVSRFSLSLVPALSALGLVLLVYRTGRLLFGPAAGALGILFATVVSPYVFAHYVRARSYYAEHLLLGQVILLGAALWLVSGRRLSAGARSRVLIAMGLAGGVGLYCGFQIVDALLPALGALLLVDPRLPLRREAWLGVGAFALGSLPLWLYNLTHDWATFATGVRLQGRATGMEASQTIVAELLPVVLGIREWVDTPPYLPQPAALVIPVTVVAAVALLAVRVIGGARRLRQDPVRAGEALLLVALAVTIGAVWYGRFVRVPRYLVPVAPVLALVLARACQLAWRRVPALTAVAAGLYVAAVAMPLVRDITVLWPAQLAGYRAQRSADAELMQFLRVHDLTRAYAFDYWLAPRLTFDAGTEIIVAEPWNERYPPHVEAVNRSPHPAYVLGGDVQTMRDWLRHLQVGAQETQVGGYTVFHDFTPPPEAAPLPRAGWAVRTSDGRGRPSDIVDGRLDTGWAAAKGPPGSAWVEVDLGVVRAVSGVVLVTDRPDRVADRLVIIAEDARGASQAAATVVTNGAPPAWLNGSLRIHPSRTVTARFAPTHARRLRLKTATPVERWSIAELFVLGPPGTGPLAPEATTLVRDAQALEVSGNVTAALARYREAMQRAPDSPEGYDGFARLATGLHRAGETPIQRAVRFARLGLLDEARAAYEEVVRVIGPDQTNADLTRALARVAAAAGDASTAARLEAEAAAVGVPTRPMRVVFGRVVELMGYDVAPVQVRAGGALEVTTHWRLLGQPAPTVMVWLHLRGPDPATRFGDDFPSPQGVNGLAPGPQQVSIRRRILVPPDARGQYRLVTGVWDPPSRSRLHVWWRGLVPTLDDAVTLGTVDVVGPNG